MKKEVDDTPAEDVGGPGASKNWFVPKPNGFEVETSTAIGKINT